MKHKPSFFWLVQKSYFYLDHTVTSFLVPDWLNEADSAWLLIGGNIITCSATWLLVWPRSAWLIADWLNETVSGFSLVEYYLLSHMAAGLAQECLADC